MKYFPFLTIFFSIQLLSCGQHIDNRLINPEGKTIETRFLLPQGYERIKAEDSSFAAFLRQLSLKPHKSQVKLYNGENKANTSVYDAVIDLQIGNKDLHQCADAVIRLRADYFYRQKQFDKIHFNFTSGFLADYSKWRSGYKIVVNGDNIYWSQSARLLNTYNDFWDYLEMVFTYAGTLSLSKEMEAQEIENMQTGNVFIKGGSPGHAVIIVDMAVDQKTNKKIFLLAQSYMPAQELHILKNPDDGTISPWYSSGFGYTLHTPEWTFTKNDLKRFKKE